MLEELLIFTRGGLILWSSCRALGLASPLKGSPIDALIRSCLLEERAADAGFTQDAYALKWAFSNDLGLVFVAVYQRMLHLLYVDDLLAAVRKEFSQIYDPKRVDYDESGFTDVFRQLHLEAEARAEAMKKTRQQSTLPSARAPASGGGGKKPSALGGRAAPQGGKKGSADSGKNDDSSDGSEDSGKEQNKLTNGTVKGVHQNGDARAAVVANNGKENGDPNDGAFDVNTLRKKIGGKKGGKKGDAAVTKKAAPKAEPKKNVKKDRVWDDQPRKVGKLDFTDPQDERGEEMVEQAIEHQGDSMMDKDEVLSSDSEDEDEEGEENAGAGQKKKGWFTSMFKRVLLETPNQQSWEGDTCRPERFYPAHVEWNIGGLEVLCS